MNLNNHVIIIPGLGNGVAKNAWAVESWKKLLILF
jgi:NAD/NADP transhydrogenase beta subunit